MVDLTRRGIAKQESLRRRRKTMRAEHADKTELNELAAHVMGCAFTILNVFAFLERSMSALFQRKSVVPVCICVFACIAC
jgi:hypothetical protein